MKMKIFKSRDREHLEREINEWLQNEGISQIHHITHANNDSVMFVTVWWEYAKFSSRSHGARTAKRKML